MSDVQATEKYNLTQGKILNKLALVSLPLIGSQIIQMTYNLADMFWLGRLSERAVAASGTAGQFLWLSMALLIIGARGAEIGVSQNIGRGDANAARGFAQSAYTLALALGLVACAVLVVFPKQLVQFYRFGDEILIQQTELYLSIVGFGLPFNFLAAAATGIFSGSGNSRTPFIINCIGLTINMALDPLLIFAFDMGVSGAAIATVTAQAVCAVLLTVLLMRGKHVPVEHFRPFCLPQWAHLKQIFQWTIPICIESFLFTTLTMVISRFVATFGTNAVATQRIGVQVESLSWLIAGGFSSALTSFVGQNYGAGKWSRVRVGVRIGSFAMVVWGLIVTAAIYCGANSVFRIFLPDSPQVIRMGGEYLRILAACQLLACLEGVAAGAFRGMGKTINPSIVSGTTNAGRVVLAYVLMGTSLGITGIWWALSLGAAARGLWMYLWYLKTSKTLPKEDTLPREVVTNLPEREWA